MIWIMLLLAVAFVLTAISIFLFSGMPDSRTSAGKNLRLVLVGVIVLILGALGVSIAIQVQEQTGVEIAGLGLSGGMESDARQWMGRNRQNPPIANEPGTNIRILREGMSFLNSHPTVKDTPQGQQIVQLYGGLPERPTRLLTRQEETQYYEGARAVYALIDRIANPDGSDTAVATQ